MASRVEISRLGAYKINTTYNTPKHFLYSYILGLGAAGLGTARGAGETQKGEIIRACTYYITS